MLLGGCTESVAGAPVSGEELELEHAPRHGATKVKIINRCRFIRTMIHDLRSARKRRSLAANREADATCAVRLVEPASPA